MKKIIHYLQKTILSALLILFATNIYAQEGTKPALTANSQTLAGSFFKASTDGSFFITSETQNIYITDAKTGRKIRSLTGSGQTLTSLDLSPNGKIVAAGDMAGNLTFWEVETGKKIRSISVASQLLDNLDFTPDGKYIAAAARGDTDIKIYDVLSGQEHLTLEAEEWQANIVSVNYNPDGTRLVSGLAPWEGEAEITIWNSSDGRMIRTIKSSSYFNEVVFNSDGTRIVSKSSNGTIQIWDPRNGKELKAIPWRTPTWDEVYANLSPVMKEVSDEAIKNYMSNNSLKSKHKKKLIEEYKEMYFGIFRAGNSNVAVSPDGISIAAYRVNEGIKIWDINTGRLLNTINSGKVSKIMYMPDGTLVSTDGLKIQMWNTETGESVDMPGNNGSAAHQVPIKLISKYNLPHLDENLGFLNPQMSEKYQTLRKTGNAVQLSSDRSKLISINHETKDLEIWDIESGKMVNQVKVEGHSALIMKHAINSDGALYATADSEGLIIVWDVRTGQQLWSVENVRKIVTTTMGLTPHVLIFNEDGNQLMAAFHAGGVKAWDSGTGKEVEPSDRWAWELSNKMKLDGGKMNRTLAKNPDGTQLLIAIDEGGFNQKSALSIREFNSGGKDRLLFNSSSMILTGAFSPDERRVVAGNQEGLVKIWDLETGQDLTLESNSMVHPLQFSPDGRYVMGGSDGGLRYWDSRSGKLLMTLYGGQGTDNWVAVAPDGRFDGTPKGMEVLHYVQGMEVIPLESYFEDYYTPNLIPRLVAGDTFAELKSIDETSLPPEVAFTSPGDGLASEDKQVTIELTVTDKGGGVDEVRLYQNGKLITGTQRGLQLADKSDTYSFDVTLTQGENQFKAVALNSDRVESIPEYLVVNYEGATSKTRLFTLTIGINEYKNPKYSLNYARSDASGFEERIIRGGESIFDEVVQTTITDADATKQNIFAALDKIKAAAGPEDMLVFYYAGHGVMSDPVTGSSEFYMAPTDITQLYGNEALLKSHGIAASEIQEYSKNIMAQKQLFVLDACQSGGATEMLAMRGAAEEKAIAQLARSTGTFWLTASGSEQFATEFAELGHGVFTYALLEGLNGKADQGAKDKKITVQELSAFLNDRVPELTQIHKGQAQYPSSYGYGQDFPIGVVN